MSGCVLQLYGIRSDDRRARVVFRIREAAVAARRRHYAVICTMKSDDPDWDAAWERHGATYDWEHRMIERFVSNATSDQRPPTARELQMIALRLASPKRAPVGAVIAAQADAAHLPLFAAANEPGLL